MFDDTPNENIAAYERWAEDNGERCAGKWAVFRSGEELGVFDDQHAALAATLADYAESEGGGTWATWPYLIQEVGKLAKEERLATLLVWFGC